MKHHMPANSPSKARKIPGWTLFMSLTAMSSAVAEAWVPPFAPAACDMELALAAAPAHLQKEAGYYVFTEDGYELARETKNGFTCIVNRDATATIKPICFDSAGAQAILPKILDFGRMLAAATPVPEIRTAMKEGHESGKYKPVERPGIAYMQSHYNRPRGDGSAQDWFPPHVMFYAPNLTNADIGFDASTFQSQIELPFVAYQGPHGYMIVRSETAARPQDHLIEACPAWISKGAPE